LKTNAVLWQQISDLRRVIFIPVFSQVYFRMRMRKNNNEVNRAHLPTPLTKHFVGVVLLTLYIRT